MDLFIISIDNAKKVLEFHFKYLNDQNGDPGRIRTCGLLIRSQALYPAGLRSQ